MSWIARTFAALSLGLAAATHGDSGSWMLKAGTHVYPYSGGDPAKLSPHVVVYLPAAFEGTRSPLIVSLHGSGNRGNDPEMLKSNLILKYAAAHPGFAFAVAIPQAPAEAKSFDAEAIDALLTELLRQLPVDPDRVYLTGNSMGGIGAWNVATRYPQRYAALAPVSSKPDVARACEVGRLPVWAFHNAEDKLFAVEHVSRAIDRIAECGGNAKLTVYPRTGHDAWSETYANPALYEWLAAQRR